MNNNAAYSSQSMASGNPVTSRYGIAPDGVTQEIIKQSRTQPFLIPKVQEKPDAHQNESAPISMAEMLRPFDYQEQKEKVAEEKKKSKYVRMPEIVRFSNHFLGRHGQEICAKVAEKLIYYSQGISVDDDLANCQINLITGEIELAECNLSSRLTIWWVNRYEFMIEIPAVIKYQQKGFAEAEEGLKFQSPESINACITLSCTLEKKIHYFITKISEANGYDNYDDGTPEKRFKLDDNLIPLFSGQDVDEAALRMWDQYFPEARKNKRLLDPYALAEKMGLKIVKCYLYNRNKVQGMLFWKDSTILIVDIEGVVRPLTVEAGTIIVNLDGAGTEVKQRIAIFHECFHYEFHWLFFALQQKYNDDLRNFKHKNVPRDSLKIVHSDGRKGQSSNDEIELKNPLKILEWQARRGASALAMPCDIVESIDTAHKNGNKYNDHIGLLYDRIIADVAVQMRVAPWQAKARLIDLGHWQARGAANYIVTGMHYGKKIGYYALPYTFSRDNCPSGSSGYEINPSEVLTLLENNETFRKLISSGQFVFVDGHICVASPLYVQQGTTRPYLTDWAIKHLDLCCLRFKKVYEADENYQFRLNCIDSDEAYNRHYADFVARGKHMSVTETNERANQINRGMPQEPSKAIDYLLEVDGKARKEKPYSMEQFAELCGVSRATVYRWRDENYQFKAEDFMRIVIGLHLPPVISTALMSVCGISLQHYGIQAMYWYILYTRFMDTILEVNDFLELEKCQTFKIATV